MSVYISIDGGEPMFVASNTGWGDLSRWLALRDAPNANHLTEHGWDEPAAALRAELDSLPTPDDPDTATTFGELHELLSDVADDAVITVTDGFGPAGEESESGTKAAKPAGHPALDIIGDAVLESLGVKPGEGVKKKDRFGHGSDARGAAGGHDPDIGSRPEVKSAVAGIGERVGAIAAAVKEKLAGVDPADVLSTVDDWMSSWSNAHSNLVADHFGVSPYTAALILTHVAAHAVAAVKAKLAG